MHSESELAQLVCLEWLQFKTVVLMTHGWDFSGHSWISGLRLLSESNKNGAEMHLECDFSPFKIQALTQSHPRWCFTVSQTWQLDLFISVGVISADLTFTKVSQFRQRPLNWPADKTDSHSRSCHWKWSYCCLGFLTVIHSKTATG